jgi:ER lumen protein retaining receptor
MGRDITL